jgi:GT2 family glycosyltransferase
VACRLLSLTSNRPSSTIARFCHSQGRAANAREACAIGVVGRMLLQMRAVPAPSRDGSEETVAVVVITRDRPADLERCLDAVLASNFEDFELAVVDQSVRSNASAELVEGRAAHDPRVRLIRDSGKGAARARNVGARATTGDLIVFTDDDTQADPTWLGLMVRALREDPRAGMAYGSVIPAPHDPREGFIVGFTPARRARLSGKLAKLRDAGISANVALRRAALESAGGFDELLGPGSYFPCAEDFDLTFRILARGYAVLHRPDARVLHYGLRDWQSGSGLIHGTYVAIGAAYMKHVRLRDPVGILLLLQELYRAFANIAINLARRSGPFGFGRLSGLLVGVFRSFELDVERRRAVYAARGTYEPHARSQTSARLS